MLYLKIKKNEKTHLKIQKNPKFSHVLGKKMTKFVIEIQ
jgi:hypothetical protein